MLISVDEDNIAQNSKPKVKPFSDEHWYDADESDEETSFNPDARNQKAKKVNDILDVKMVWTIFDLLFCVDFEVNFNILSDSSQN